MDISWALNQTAVYWERLDPDGYGDYDWEDGVEIACRWTQKTELIVDSNGEEVVSNAHVMVDQDMAVGDCLMLGTIDSITSAQDPATTAGVQVIKRFDKVPDISGTEFVRVAWL